MKATCSGAIIRPELFEGKKEKGLQLIGFNGRKTNHNCNGRKSRSQVLNEAIRKEIESIMQTFDVIHLCGKGNLDTITRKITWL